MLKCAQNLVQKLDPDLDHHQKLVSSLEHTEGSHQNSCKLFSSFFNTAVHRQTDRQTDRQTYTDENITSPILGNGGGNSNTLYLFCDLLCFALPRCAFLPGALCMETIGVNVRIWIPKWGRLCLHPCKFDCLSVCLSVCLRTVLLKSYWKDLHEIRCVHSVWSKRRLTFGSDLNLDPDSAAGFRFHT